MCSWVACLTFGEESPGVFIDHAKSVHVTQHSSELPGILEVGEETILTYGCHVGEGPFVYSPSWARGVVALDYAV